MHKIKRFCFSHRFFFGILAFILIYAFVFAGKLRPWRAEVVAYEFHALDLGFGFGSFVLPGQIYQWICGAPDYGTLTAYHTVLLLLFFVVLAAFSERFLLAAGRENRRAAAVLLFLFLTGPSTFSMYVSDLGMPEVYWVFLAAMFFACLAYKPLHPATALLCVLALLVNYAAILCFVPFFCVLLLYKYTDETKKSAKRLLFASFALCVAVSVAFYCFIAPATMKNMKYSFEEYNQMMRDRGVTELTYTDSLLYGHYETPPPQEFYDAMTSSPFYTQGDSLTPVQRLVNFAVFRVNMVKLHVSQGNRSPLMVLVPLLAILPVLVLIFRFCIAQLINKKNAPLRRFAFFCMPALFVFGIAVAWPLSFDFFKWLNFAFLPLFASFLYVAYREPGTVFGYVKKAVSAISFPQVLMYCSVYSVCVLSAYY